MDLLRIAQCVRQTRKQQNLTVEALADKSGFSKTYISRLENFRITPSIKSLSKIAERKLNPFVIEYTPNKEQRGFLAHDSEEFFVLLEGAVEFMVYDDDHCTSMKPEQTFYLAEGVPHRVQLTNGCDYAKALIVYSKEDTPVES